MLTVRTDLGVVIVETLFQDDLKGGEVARRASRQSYFGRLLHCGGNVCEIVDVFLGFVRG